MKPEVVFVPGLLGDRWIFQEVESRLPEVSTYTLDYPTYPFSLTDMAKAVSQTVREGGYVVGTSMGGYVALLTAALYPRSVGGIVLVNTFSSPARMLGWKRHLIRALRPVPKGKWLKWIVRSGIGDAHFGYSEKVKAYVLGVLDRMTPEALYSRLKALADAPELPGFPEGVRAMVIYNEKDPTVPPGERRALIDLVRPEKLVMCKSGGHFPYLEEPEGFASTLREFIGKEHP